MRLLATALIFLGIVFGSAAMADDTEKKRMRGELTEMGAEGHAKRAEQLTKMAGLHKALSECLKTNKGEGKKCKVQRDSLKAARTAVKAENKGWKGDRKAMREKLKGMRKNKKSE